MRFTETRPLRRLIWENHALYLSDIRVTTDGTLTRDQILKLLPPFMPHSPQRRADTVGLVIERQRRPGELDGFQWYCENCNHKLYEEFFELTDIETQFPALFERFYSSLEKRTCSSCGTVMERAR